MKAPQLGHVDLVLGRQTAGDIYRSERNVQVKWGARAAEMRPLRPRLEVIHRLRGLHLDRPHQLAALVGRCQYQIRVDLQRPDLDRRALVLADVRDDLVFPLQLDQEKPDHAIVLELLANGTHQNRAHLTSGKRRTALKNLKRSGQL